MTVNRLRRRVNGWATSELPLVQQYKPATTDLDVTEPVLISDLWIQTKGTDDEPPMLVRFQPNAVQQEILDEICPTWRDDPSALSDIRGLREIDLKARQFGVSTLIIGLYFLITVNNPDTNTVIIADDMDNSEALFQKVHIFWSNLPVTKRPHVQHATKRELHFDRIRSRFVVMTAGRMTAGRSRTIHNLHCSEVPFWPNPGILTGLLQAVPRSGNVVLESTANGEDAVFHAEYWKAKKSESPYHARFIPWWRHPEYELPAPEGFVRTEPELDEAGQPIRGAAPSETEVAMRYSLDSLFGTARTNDKLYWRRQKRAEPGMGNLFAQEYPGDDKEAFRVSGFSFFTEWDEDRHVVDPFDIPAWWVRFGGNDWGYGKPFGFLYGAIDERGGVVLFGEAYGSGFLNHEQVSRIQAILAQDGRQPDEVNVHCDPSMWNEKKDKEGVGYRDVDDYLAAKLRCVKANNTRTGRGGGSLGWGNVRRYLHDEIAIPGTSETYPAIRILRGTCPNLCRIIPQMKHDPNNPEDMDSELEDHLADSLRYMLNSWPRAPKDPYAPKPPPPDRWVQMDEDYRRTSSGKIRGKDYL